MIMLQEKTNVMGSIDFRINVSTDVENFVVSRRDFTKETQQLPIRTSNARQNAKSVRSIVRPARCARLESTSRVAAGRLAGMPVPVRGKDVTSGGISAFSVADACA
jgi:hypothetical protein